MNKKLQERKEKAKELRSTHFTLGHEDISKAHSEYIEEYQKYPINSEDNLGDKLGLKKSHFNLGNDSMKDPYLSLYKRDHVQFDKVAASTLDTDTLKDLRRHHFQLGSDQGFPKSEAQENFIARDLPKGTREEFAHVMNRNKAENLHFADDANYFSSVYNEKYNKNLDPNNPHKGIDRAEIKKQVTALQQSNITLGSQGEDYGTSMRNAFANKHGSYERAAPSINLMQTNFVTGDDMQPTESMYAHYHKKFPIEVAKLNDDLQKDLRAHHFKFGDKEVNYESASAQFFKEPGAESYKDKDKNPLLYKNHFAFGDNAPTYQTSYNAVHQEYNAQMPNRANDSKRDRASNIVLGYADTEKRSEAQSQFVKYQDPKKAKLDENLSKDLKQSHFKFDTPMQYESYSHGVYKDVLDKAKEINPKGTMTELANDLRRNHFEYGNDYNQFRTSQRDAYQGLAGKSSTLEKELANDLRRNHFDVGTNGKLAKDTTYRVNFEWKVAQDD
jgi:hypothetical protein